VALQRLGREAFDLAWSAGRRLDVEKAVEEALAFAMPASAGATADGTSARITKRGPRS
jgi:hypothetical protein